MNTESKVNCLTILLEKEITPKIISFCEIKEILNLASTSPRAYNAIMSGIVLEAKYLNQRIKSSIANDQIHSIKTALQFCKLFISQNEFQFIKFNFKTVMNTISSEAIFRSLLKYIRGELNGICTSSYGKLTHPFDQNALYNTSINDFNSYRQHLSADMPILGYFLDRIEEEPDFFDLMKSAQNIQAWSTDQVYQFINLIKSEFNNKEKLLMLYYFITKNRNDLIINTYIMSELLLLTKNYNQSLDNRYSCFTITENTPAEQRNIIWALYYELKEKFTVLKPVDWKCLENPKKES